MKIMHVTTIGHQILAVFVLASVFVANAVASTAPDVLQLDPLEAGMCVAVKVPVAEGQSVSGLTWYNNDAATAFPEVLVAAGYTAGLQTWPMRWSCCRTSRATNRTGHNSTSVRM